MVSRTGWLPLFVSYIYGGADIGWVWMEYGYGVARAGAAGYRVQPTFDNG